MSKPANTEERNMTTDPDTLYVSAETSEALLRAAGFTRWTEADPYVAPTGEKYWVRSEAAQHAIRVLLGRV